MSNTDATHLIAIAGASGRMGRMLVEAVQAAIKEGTLEPARLERWRQLQAENRERTPVYSGPKGNKTLRTKKY